MANVNLSGMNVEALMDLRMRVDEMLLKHRAEIEQHLERMDRTIAVVGRRRIVRGARPRWLVAAIKDGKKLDHYLIDKSAGKGRKKRRSKR
jgi:hypothetical protein